MDVGTGSDMAGAAGTAVGAAAAARRPAMGCGCKRVRCLRRVTAEQSLEAGAGPDRDTVGAAGTAAGGGG